MLDASPRPPTQSRDRSMAEHSSFRHRRLWFWFAILIAVVALVGGYAWWQMRPAAPQYVTAPVTRGDVVRAVISTGTLNPVVTVQVGSYVSGTIQKLLCD